MWHGVGVRAGRRYLPRCEAHLVQNWHSGSSLKGLWQSGGSRMGSGRGAERGRQHPQRASRLAQTSTVGLLPVPHTRHPQLCNALPRCPFSSGSIYSSVLISNTKGSRGSQMTWAKVGTLPLDSYSTWFPLQWSTFNSA